MRTLRHRSSEFTLIELIIVFAITALLPVIAISKWQDYLIRRQVGDSGRQ